MYHGTVIRRKNILKVRCILWLFGKFRWQTNLPYWQPSSPPLKDSVSSDYPSAFHQRRNTSKEWCLRSRWELMDFYIKWMTYSSSDRHRVSTMNASGKCLEDSRMRTSHWTRKNISSRFKKSSSWARPSMSRESAQINTRSKQFSTCRNQHQRYPSISRNDQPIGEVYTTSSGDQKANARSSKQE